MKGLINELLKNAMKKHQNIRVFQRYLRIKYRINIGLDALKKRRDGLRKDI